MIRRGLQVILVVGITALGAAPCFAVVWPSEIEMTSRLWVGPEGQPGYIGFDGTWERLGSENGTFSYGSGAFYLQVSEDGLAILTGIESQIALVFVPDFGWQIVSQPEGQGWVIDQSQTDQWFAFYGDGVNFDSRSQPLSYLLNQGDPDPYAENFPDWESATVKIPLGFGLGMAFWAVMLGFGVPMRWVKELTNAAT